MAERQLCCGLSETAAPRSSHPPTPTSGLAPKLTAILLFYLWCVSRTDRRLSVRRVAPHKRDGGPCAFLWSKMNR